MRKLAVINVVGLTSRLLGPATPHLKKFLEKGQAIAIDESLPAVTCTAQASYLTGAHVSEHGIVGNGWYFRDECEVKFWRQSNKLIQAPLLWDVVRKHQPQFTCANIGWWYNMYSSVDYTVTPRPIYTADGRKLPDIYTNPPELRYELQNELGTFPLFNFWGPNTSIRSSRWIAEAALWVDNKYDPTLSLIYLPHLDYNLQRLGPSHPAIHQDLQQVDEVCGSLITHYEAQGAGVIILSEYGITDVNQPVHINRLLRQHGLISVREERGGEVLDAGASRAFAVADHQIAHIYINDPSKKALVKRLLEDTSGIAQVLDDKEKQYLHIAHARAGDLIAIAEEYAWFTYYYWMEDTRAPDFARTVDIHRKPGYDPVELFIDPALKLPSLTVAWTLLKKQLGLRYLMDIIPLDADLVKGSHGRQASRYEDKPVLLTRHAELINSAPIQARQVYQVIMDHLHLGLDEGGQPAIAQQ